MAEHSCILPANPKFLHTYVCQDKSCQKLWHWAGFWARGG